MSKRLFSGSIHPCALALLLAMCSQVAWAQNAAPPMAARLPSSTLIVNAQVFDGRGSKPASGMNVLVEGNIISRISHQPLAVPAGATVIDAAGRTLMPGLIDAHTHLMFASIPQIAVLTSDVGFINVAAVKEAGDMLMRGFTSVRDLGGPVMGLKRGIDLGLVPGPRIWPAGAFISQSGGHGDFRLPNDLPARPGDFSFSERSGAAAIADSPDTVRQRVREQLALGASQIKLMAGGGVASPYDPLDVTQYSLAEMRAAVEAAENWGTYVTVHAYTPRAVRQAIEAGVKCIGHGQLLDEQTARLMADKGIWWSLQPFLDDEDANPFPAGSASRAKQLQMMAGTDAAYHLARKHRIRTAWGTDTLSDSKLAAKQGKQLAKMARWFSPAEVLRMATSVNAQLLALSGQRSPYPGKLGVVEEGALADLLLVDGNPLDNLRLIEDPSRNFVLIMKDGTIYKNTLSP
jgi:imidazolonepropionase-like amidohydrolase